MSGQGKGHMASQQAKDGMFEKAVDGLPFCRLERFGFVLRKTNIPDSTVICSCSYSACAAARSAGSDSGTVTPTIESHSLPFSLRSWSCVGFPQSTSHRRGVQTCKVATAPNQPPILLRRLGRYRVAGRNVVVDLIVTE
jgi:hypothetical protein